MSYTDDAINTAISALVPQSGPANIIGLMLKQLLAERDEMEQELLAEQQACVDMWKQRDEAREQRDAALARVAVLEGALGFYADVNNWFLEKTYTGASQICIRGNDRSDVDQGDEVYTCGGKRARAALSQSPSEALAAVRLAQESLRYVTEFLESRSNDKSDLAQYTNEYYDALKALNDAFGEGEGT